MKFTKDFSHGRACRCDNCVEAERELAAAFDRERFDLLTSVTGIVAAERPVVIVDDKPWRPSDRRSS